MMRPRTSRACAARGRPGCKIREDGAVRLTVHRTNGHIYAQITPPRGDKVLASASTLEKDLRAPA